MSTHARRIVATILALGLFGALLHGASAQVVTGTVTVQKYYCTYLDETLLVEAIDTNECSPGGATFTFYLVGDGSAEYQQLTVGASGSGSIDLVPGAYEMVEEGTQTFFDLSVVEGQTTSLLIGNPAANVQPTVPPAQPTTVPAQPTAPPQLPRTGSGTGNASVIPTLAMVAAVACVAGGVIAMRRFRSE
jgi:hypothetical protein